MSEKIDSYYPADTLGAMCPIDLGGLEAAYIPGRGVNASNSDNFKGMLFVRDGVQVAFDMFRIYSPFARDIITTACIYQGLKTDLITDERPGKAFHQLVEREVNGITSPRKTILGLNQHRDHWGGTKDRVLYYGAMDPSMRTAELICDFTDYYGRDFLEETFIRSNGEIATFRDALRGYLGYTERAIRQTGDGLIWHTRTNPRGMENPVMTDSGTALIHPDGEIANHNGPKVFTDLQGYAHSALTKAARVLGDDLSGDASRWKELAEMVQEATFKRLWNHELGFPAQGMDKDPRTFKDRQIAAVAASPLWLLGTTIFDGLSPSDQQFYISSMLKVAFDPNRLWTEAGIKGRSKEHGEPLGFPDYWSNVWTVATDIVAMGLGRLELQQLKRYADVTILNSSQIGGKPYEFFVVTKDGRVIYRPVAKSSQPLEVVITHNIPEATQSFARSAELRARADLMGPNVTDAETPSWKIELQEQILNSLPDIHLLSPDEAKKIRLSHPKVVLDTKTAGKMDAQIRAESQKLQAVLF